MRGLLPGLSVLSALCATVSPAQVPPAILPHVRYEQRIGAGLPAGLSFLDDHGRNVSLASLIGSRPVLLTLARYGCDRLCPVLLNGVVHALQPLPLRAGTDYAWVVVSLDPSETPVAAARVKHGYLERYAQSGGAQGWHFLSGSEKAVRLLADSIGCRYFHDPRTGTWAEPMGLALLSPGGRISSYLLGSSFDSGELGARIEAASEGERGAPEVGPQEVCYPYDPTQNPRGASLVGWLRLASAANILALAGLVSWLLRRERRALRGMAP